MFTNGQPSAFEEMTVTVNEKNGKDVTTITTINLSEAFDPTGSIEIPETSSTADSTSEGGRNILQEYVDVLNSASALRFEGQDYSVFSLVDPSHIDMSKITMEVKTITTDDMNNRTENIGVYDANGEQKTNTIRTLANGKWYEAIADVTSEGDGDDKITTYTYREGRLLHRLGLL